MAIEIKIPIPDQTTEEVRIVTWCKAIGDAVQKGDVLLEIETDKAVMEVESAGAGILLQQLVAVDDMVPVGEVIGFIGAEGTEIETQPAVSAKAPEEKPAQETSEGYKIKKTTITPLARKIAEKTGLNLDTIEGTGAHGKILRKDLQAASTGTSLHEGRLFASPNAKRLAKELAVDIYSIQGTGPNGRVIGEDVIEYAKNKPTMDYTPAQGQPQPGTQVELTKMRRAIGINLQNSFRDTPHFNVTMSIDMTRAMKFRAGINKGKEKSEKVSVNDLVVKACAFALRKYPAVNSKFMKETIRYEADVNIGVATAVDAGLIVPVVLNTDKLDWKQLAAETKLVVARARGGKLVGLGKGTFTVSNLGMFGVDEFTAIINPPEAAILAVGGLKEEVVAENGMTGVKPMMKVTLCSDHRVVDGALAAQFLRCIKLYLEEEIA
ncbi:MAG: 2-oxo acid dehydrogenase subunit E2 [Planctomycetes bacterium]|nr:2-oxo acid dehydrogenase subunit E2 [Planctomycetota bacterium]